MNLHVRETKKATEETKLPPYLKRALNNNFFFEEDGITGAAPRAHIGTTILRNYSVNATRAHI